jgi:type VI secretion system secreted protein VgrG
VVVGKSGEEIWTDKYGRIKVQFHWDRYGKNDENSSCWVRVAQVWAGKQWGAMFIPRVGQEVLVDFLEGDPDRPIVTGGVYNADQMPPYALPENQTQSGLKTRSTKAGDEKSFNELRFEDKKGAEQIYFHAEKDFERVVENNDSLKVGFEKKDKGDQSIAVFNNRTLSVGDDAASDGSETVTIKKNRTATLKEGDESLTVKMGDRTVKLDQGNDSLTLAQGNRTVKLDGGNDSLTLTQGNRTVKLTAGKCTIEAGQGITLKVGANSIEITQQGITIKGLQTQVQGTAQLTLSGPMTTVKGDGMLTLQGGLVKIN